MKHFSFKGPVDLDLSKEIFKFLLSAGCLGHFRGMTLGSITDNFNRQHDLMKSDETIRQVLASLGDMVKTTINENGETLYSLKGNKPDYESQPVLSKSADMATTASTLHELVSNSTTGKWHPMKARLSKKGQAKTTIPSEIFEKLGNSKDLKIKFLNGYAIIRADEQTTKS